MRRLFLIATFFFIVNLTGAQQIKTSELYPFVQMQKGNYQVALDTLEGLNQNRQNIDFYLAQIEAAYQLKQYQKSLEIGHQLEKIKPNITASYQSKIYLKIDDYQSAKAALIRNLHSSSKLSLFELLTDKDYEKLVDTEFLDSILQSGIYTSAEKQLYQVEQLIHQKKFTDALFLTQEIISRNKNIHKAYFLHSIISFQMNDLNKAIDDINRALEITKVPALYYFQRAQLLADKGDYKNALTDIEKVIRKEPYETDFYLFQAGLLFQLEKYKEVVSVIDALLPLMPDNPEVLILKAKTLYRDQKFIEALKVVNESFGYRQSKEQFELRGDIYSATNTYEYAIQDYSMYLDIEPYNGDIYAKKGYARLKNGDKAGACSDWEKGKRYGSYEAIKYWEKYCR